jgi:hypothetical protein
LGGPKTLLHCWKRQLPQPTTRIKIEALRKNKQSTLNLLIKFVTTDKNKIAGK